MKLKHYFLFLTLITISCAQSFAQALAISSTSTTESRCQATGTITVNATGGTSPYLYAVTAGPMTKSNQSSNVLTAMQPGSYTVRVTDNVGAVVTKTAVVVAGNYSLMNPINTQFSPLCAGGSNGMIRCSIPTTTGRAPYGFRITAPAAYATSVHYPGSNIDTFKNLPAGTYTYEVSDSCGNIQTRTSVIVTDPTSPNPASISLYYDYKTACDTVTASELGTSSGGTSPFKVEIYYNQTTDTGLPDQTIRYVSGAPGQKIVVPYANVLTGGAYNHYYVLTDTCGRVVKKAIATHLFNITNNLPPQTTCGNLDIMFFWRNLKTPIKFYLYPNLTTSGAPIDSMTITSLVVGVNGVMMQSNTFKNLPASGGPYSIKAIDSCGYVMTDKYTFPARTKSITRTVVGCHGYVSVDSTAMVTIAPSNLSGDKIRFSFISGPTSFSNKYTSINRTFSYPHVDSVNNGFIYLYNLPIGTYKIAVTDTCGWTDTTNFSITSSNIVRLTSNTTFQAGCINANRVSMYASSSPCARSAQFVLYNSSGGAVASKSGSGSIDSFIINSLPSGTYIAQYRYPPNSGYDFMESSYSSGGLWRTHNDTVVLVNYSQPSLSTIIAAPCPGKSLGSLVCTGAGGLRPYRYSITAGPTTRSLQYDSIFTDLPFTSGTPYTVYIVDSCGNSNTANISMGSINRITSAKNPTCGKIGQAFQISADSAYRTTYSWTGPGGFTSSNRIVNIASFPNTGFGKYVVNTTSLGSCTGRDSIYVGSCMTLVTENGTVNSNGGIAINNIAANDTVAGLNPTVGLGGLGILSKIGSWPSGITLDSLTGAVTVAKGVTPGRYPVSYQLCDSFVYQTCQSMTDTIIVTPYINPAAENGSIPATGGVAINNVIANDSTNGVPTTIGVSGNSTISESGSWPSGISLNTSTGEVSVALGTAPGTYAIEYQLCDKLSPTTCATKTDTIFVTPIITPTSENGSTTTFGGVAISNIVSNDSTNAHPSTLGTSGNSNVSQSGSWPSGITLDTLTGTVSVALGTTPGTYTIDYQLCDKLTPTTCATKTDTIFVTPEVRPKTENGSISTSTGGVAVSNVLTNDSTNGAPSTIGGGGNSTIAEVGSWPSGISLNTSTGAISVTIGTTPGIYPVVYQLCDKLLPTCANITDTITIEANISPLPDSGSVASTGGVAINDITVNDSTNGAPTTLGVSGNSTISQSGSWPSGITLNTTTGEVTVASGTAPGSYSLTYQLCDKLLPVTCKTANIKVDVTCAPSAPTLGY